MTANFRRRIRNRLRGITEDRWGRWFRFELSRDAAEVLADGLLAELNRDVLDDRLFEISIDRIAEEWSCGRVDGAK